MPSYLIDINLPYYISLWNTDEYIHQRDLDPQASDATIWQYAKLRKLKIITKDRDYSDRILLSSPPPRIIHLRIGNLKLRDFYLFLNPDWKQVLKMSRTHKLVVVSKNSIEGIN